MVKKHSSLCRDLLVVCGGLTIHSCFQKFFYKAIKTDVSKLATNFRSVSTRDAGWIDKVTVADALRLFPPRSEILFDF